MPRQAAILLGRLIMLIMLIALGSAACADKAPPALFPHPQPPELARPIQPTCSEAEGDPDPRIPADNPADSSRPACEDDPAPEP